MTTDQIAKLPKWAQERLGEDCRRHEIFASPSREAAKQERNEPNA